MKINYQIYSFDCQIYIDFLNKCDEETLIYLAKNDPNFSLEFIKKPSEEVQLAMVAKNGGEIWCIKNPSKKVQLEAVKNDPYVIQYIKKPDADVQIEAIKNLDNFVDKADVHIFVFHFLKYLNNSLALSLLYNKTTNSKVKNKIKSSKYWKDDANLILEVIDE